VLKIKKIIMTAVATASAIALLNVCGVNANAAEKSASQNYVEAMIPGWNLGNTFDSVDTWSDRTASWWSDPGETTWGNPRVTKELIHKIKESGFKSIRMPFTSYTRTGDAPEYKIKKEYLDRYAEVVNYALDEGLIVLADMQHVDISVWGHNMYTDDGSSLAQFKALWKQFAEYFKDYPEQLCFEPTNEPDFVGTKDQKLKINNDVNNTFREIIRSSGGKNATRMLVFPNLVTSSDKQECNSNAQNIASLKDPNIIATFHYYSFWPFSVNIAGKPKFDAEVQGYAKEAIDNMYDTFTSKGVGVIGGEYSVLAEGVINNGEYLKYMDYTTAYAREKGIPMMLWDAGFHINRNTCEWKDQDVIDTIMTAAHGGRTSYTDCDTLYVNGKTRIAGATTNLTLNGNKLTSIVDSNNKVLVQGVDYTCANGKLTFNPSYLKKVTKSGYGKCETLVLNFDNGSYWKMNVNYYKMPVSSDAKGSNSGLNIPMQFNGAKLATMEAVRADQEWQGVGPADWTPYKQFKEHFEPDYDNNVLVIKDAFFKECIDGNIIFKFHWEDGAITTYKIYKSGNTVKGVAVNGEDTTVSTEPDEPEQPEQPEQPEVLAGDVNGDNVVNIADYTTLKKYINANGEGIKINEANSDVNGDGKVSFLDLLALKALV